MPKQAPGNQPPTSLNTFKMLKLPTELLLVIGEQLDPEYRVLLGLTCKQLFALFSKHFDMSLRGDGNLAVRTRMLQHLEFDHPEYLTCRGCGWMFRWGQLVCNLYLGRYFEYCCPRRGRHSQEYLDVSLETPMVHRPSMDRETVDLVTRYNLWGPKYGIPASSLGGKCSNDLGDSQKETVHWINGQVWMYRHTTFGPQTHKLKRQGAREDPWEDEWEEHGLDELLPPFLLPCHPEAAPVCNFREGQTTLSLKCACCETDAHFGKKVLGNGGTVCTLEVWQNFGNRDPGPLSVQQIWHDAHRVERLDETVVANRDLRAYFNNHTNRRKRPGKASNAFWTTVSTFGILSWNDIIEVRPPAWRFTR